MRCIMIKTIAILGAGTMGYGLALDFARAGLSVHLMDVTDELVQRGLANLDISLNVFKEEGLINEDDIARTRANITTFTDLPAAVADVDAVIEALPEVLSIKHDVLKQADAAAPAGAVFITNSSGLRLSDICSVLTPERRTRALMAHYFNPPEIMPLVELLSLPETDEALMVAMRDFYLSIDKVPVRLKKEVAGLSANRIQMALWRELFWQLDNGVMDKEDLDKVLAYGPAMRWATTGVLTMLDMTGLDIVHAICNNLMKELDDSKQAPAALSRLIEEHKLGLKTGEGFFTYPEASRPGVKDGYVRRLARQYKVTRKNVK